nr:toll/interleukin-1 receptor domain-containing protein [Lysobacter lactosilyticus]
MSVREAYESDWKSKVTTRIRRSDGVIALISKNSLSSSGQRREIECARAERKPVLFMWAYTIDRTVPTGTSPVAWSWPTISNFIDRV